MYLKTEGLFDQMQTLETISKLLLSFEHAKVRYVHWKTNVRIDRALSGSEDLDILVHPKDAVAAEKVLIKLRFIRGFSPRDHWQETIFHYYAMEADGSQLVHLHLHYSLTLGYEYHENFTPEVIDWYLEGRWIYGDVFLPAPEKEYILLVIRTLIKNSRSVAALEFPIRQFRNMRLLGNSTRTDAVDELVFLHSRVGESALRTALLSSQLPVTYEHFVVLASLAEGAGGRKALRKGAEEIKSLLANTRQTSEVVSFCLASYRLFRARVSILRCKFGGPNPGAKLPQFGGRIVAFIGGDGAGKSTNVTNTFRTLESHFRTIKIHIGRPRRSLRGNGLTSLAKLARVARRPQLAEDLSHLALANNRLREFQRAQRARRNGAIVVMDRLPHPAITTMDGPRIRTRHSKLQTWFSAVEQTIYDRICGVDLIVVLKLAPEIACERRPEDDRNTLLERSGEIWEQDWDVAHALTVNTGEISFAQAESIILNRFWEELSHPFLRLEVLGTTGAGKSTLASALASQFPNSATVLPYRKNLIALVVPALHAMWLTGVPCNTFQIHLWKNVAHILFFRRACLRGEISISRPPMHLILDQGPLFQITLAEKEGMISQDVPLVSETLESFNNLKGIGLFLSTNRRELRQRILARAHQPTRGSNMSDGEFDVFAKNYDRLYEALKGQLVRRIELSSKDTKELTLKNSVTQIFLKRSER